MKTILITGANRGLGLELSKQYLANGWRVIACCRDPNHADSLKKINENNLSIMKLDVGNAEEIKQFSNQIKNERIDILMNNAGIIGSRTEKLGEIDPSLWLETFKVNSIAPLLVTQALMDQVAQSDAKLIVNMSSFLGSISLNADSGYYLYRSSKAALNAVTKNLSIDLKPKGITVISLHPGWVKTDMGGENAPLQPEQSVHGIMLMLGRLTMKDTGSFISYDGTRLAW